MSNQEFPNSENRNFQPTASNNRAAAALPRNTERSMLPENKPGMVSIAIGHTYEQNTEEQKAVTDISDSENKR